MRLLVAIKIFVIIDKYVFFTAIIINFKEANLKTVLPESIIKIQKISRESLNKNTTSKNIFNPLWHVHWGS